MTFARFALQADANFIYLLADHRVQGKYSADALIDEVFGISETSLNFILAAASGKSTSVISRAVSANAEVIRLIDLPIISGREA